MSAMAKSEPMTVYEWVGASVMALGVGFILFLLLGTLYLGVLTKEYPLPDRFVSLPAPKLIWDFTKTQAGAGELVVYAKEPISFNRQVGGGFYLLYGYLGASQALNASVGVYARTKDPKEDPACKPLIAPLAVKDGAVDSTVYVCEEKQNDLRVASAEFVNVGLSSFCSSKSSLGESARAGRIFQKGRFWIGTGWNPLFPHPLAFNFSNMVAYGPFPTTYPSSCVSTSRSR
jgi:hypothetical protein